MQKYLNYVAQLHENKQNEIDFINNQLAKHLKTEQENQTEIEHILDFLFATDKSYKNIGYKTILEKAIAWDKKLQSLSSKDDEIEGVDYEIVYDFGDGYRFVKLKSQSSYNREGKLMSHCVASYYGRDVAIYSLRDSNNNPHCTIEENKQVKGKGNQTVDNKYFGYCIKLLHHLGCKMGENEMRNIGYYKLDSIDEGLTCDELRDGKYVSEKNIDKIKDKDGDVYMGFGLLKIKKLFEFDLNMKLKFNFDMNVITSYFRSKLKKGKIDKESYNKVAMTDNNEVAMTDYNKVAMTYNNKVAMTDNNEVAMTYNNKVAMTYNNKVAMTYNNKVAMTDNNEVAMTDYNKVAMTYNNKVAMTDNNEVAMTYNNKVAMTYNNKVAMTYNNKVAMTDNNEVAMTYYNKVAMTDNNKVAMTYNNKVAMTYYNKVAMTDNNKVAMTYNNKVAMTYNNKVAMTYNNKVAMTYNNKVAMTDNNEVAMTDYNKVAMTSYNKVAMTDNNDAVGNSENTISCGKNNAILMGNDSKVKGGIGTIIVLYNRDNNNTITDYATAVVDGKKIKEDTFYKLEGGKFVKCK